jgi:hypothetical protein
MKPEDKAARSTDFDPVRKVSREARSFNLTWLKNGERLTWVQRIGFGIFSLSFLYFGLYAAVELMADILHNDFTIARTLWDLTLAALFALIFLLPGILGLRNVLRFPKVPERLG